MEPLNEHDELKRLAPVLHGLPKADPFVVPDGFFDRFPHQVQAVIAAQLPRPGFAWPLWKRLALALPIVALLVLGAWVFTRGTGPAEASLADVTPLTDGELDAIDDHEILAAFDEADANDITSEDLGEVALQLNDDEILAYLENEDADINELITDIE